jgi:hypothetical protein
LDAAGAGEAAGEGAGAAGAVATGAGARGGLGAAGFLAAATAGDAEAAGRGEDDGALAAGLAERGAGDAVDEPGSAVMMLTGGVDAALGNSALVGRPVGTPGTNAATGGAADGDG